MLSRFCFVNGTSSPRAGARNSVSCADLICHCHRALLEPAAKAVVLNQPNWLKYILCPFHLKNYSKLFSSQIILFNVGKYLVNRTCSKHNLVYFFSTSKRYPGLYQMQRTLRHRFLLCVAQKWKKKRMRRIWEKILTKHLFILSTKVELCWWTWNEAAG